jgi:hypothetical protein
MWGDDNEGLFQFVVVKGGSIFLSKFRIVKMFHKTSSLVGFAKAHTH